MVYLGGLIETYMFECTDANQLEVHTKANYNSTDSTMTFYIGKSESDFFQKWDIPLRKVYVDLNMINSTVATLKNLNIKGIEQDSVITYSDKRSGETKQTKSFNIYLYDWCDKKNQENFITALERMTELSRTQ